jgi:23S rRNA (uracil1939-C5)-methyltransferase
MDISGYPFRFAVGSFSQSNRKILTPLAKLLQEAVRPGRLVDIYAGAGLLAFMVLMGKSSFSSVLCVESDKRNAEFIRDNLSHVTSEDTAISVVIDTAERAIRKKNLMRTDRLTDGGVTTLVLDPPRGGLSSAVRTWLVRPGSVDRSVPDVAYLSCDSAALARDLAALAPRYRIESMTLLDFFPQTSHIETLVILRPHSR